MDETTIGRRELPFARARGIFYSRLAGPNGTFSRRDAGTAPRGISRHSLFSVLLLLLPFGILTSLNRLESVARCFAGWNPPEIASRRFVRAEPRRGENRAIPAWRQHNSSFKYLTPRADALKVFFRRRRRIAGNRRGFTSHRERPLSMKAPLDNSFHAFCRLPRLPA